MRSARRTRRASSTARRSLPSCRPGCLYPVGMADGNYRVGILGATGAVGSTLLSVLTERDFPVAELVPFSSERSAGKKLDFRGSTVECRTLSEESIQGLDL